ncbi:hypothetical protein DRJ25_05515, partial [Candidatus Woesearchaeota archaeon]
GDKEKISEASGQCLKTVNNKFGEFGINPADYDTGIKSDTEKNETKNYDPLELNVINAEKATELNLEGIPPEMLMPEYQDFDDGQEPARETESEIKTIPPEIIADMEKQSRTKEKSKFKLPQRFRLI